MERVLILNEHAIHLTLSVNFDGQFEDGLSVLDSLCTRTAALYPQKKSEKGYLWGSGRLRTGQSQTDNPFLALASKRQITKFPCPVFFMIAKDCTERLSAVALSIGLIIRAVNAFGIKITSPRLRGKTPNRN